MAYRASTGIKNPPPDVLASGEITSRVYLKHSSLQNTIFHTQGMSRHITGLCTADDEDDVLPPVILPPAVVFFSDVAFCANAYIAVKFSAAIILIANTATTIMPPN
jgi:hypothetical protein